MPSRTPIFLAGAVALGGVLVAACSFAGSGPPGGSAGAGAANGSSSKQTAQQALLTAATESQRVTSAVETINVQANGGQSVTSGTIALQLKPQLKASESLTVSAGGQTTHLKVILTGNSIYISEPGLRKHVGKPWVKLNLRAMGALGAGLEQLFHSIQTNSFANQARLMAVAKNSHVVGTQTIDGVATTEYAGSFQVAQALKVMPSSLRKVFRPALHALGNTDISFREWIDAQHHVRKVVEVETVNGQTITTTVQVTAINQPVHITLPPASRTAVPPGA